MLSSWELPHMCSSSQLPSSSCSTPASAHLPLAFPFSPAISLALFLGSHDRARPGASPLQFCNTNTLKSYADTPIYFPPCCGSSCSSRYGGHRLLFASPRCVLPSWVELDALQVSSYRFCSSGGAIQFYVSDGGICGC